ncbi:TniQ family protein [Nocardia australiensis]|uniref:TniQ family protein n=1 Tax=Nocardia australiensis TaxID=2887191 RepID=UPI001D14593D|nr:TniQ family protein [Nocardia australiensis]
MKNKLPDPVCELRRTGAALPRVVAPLPAELVSSYIHRLADANLLNAADLHTTITGDRRTRAAPRITILARLSSFPENTLRHALPELRTDDHEKWPLSRKIPGCTLCATARGATRPFRVWQRGPEDVVCRRHRRWIAGAEDGWRDDEQLSVADQPEILQAHRLHLRLIRNHGRPNTTIAFNQATWILDEWRKTEEYDYYSSLGFEHRISTFLGPDWQQLTIGSTVTVAARYPRQVALTRLLVSPFWKEHALRDQLQAGRPHPEHRLQAATAIGEYRRTIDMWGPIPLDLARALMVTYLLLDGPHLRTFLDELRRTVEPRYRWDPIPAKPVRADLLGAEKFDPLVQWVQDEIHDRLHPGQQQWEYLAEVLG